jgi:hypothetical protein
MTWFGDDMAVERNLSNQEIRDNQGDEVVLVDAIACDRS